MPAASQPGASAVFAWVRHLRVLLIALAATLALASPALAQWPTACVDLNDIVEAHLGNPGNIQICRRPFGDRTAADLVRHHVLRLTYTSHNMAPFARDLGHDGPPFPWDEEARRHLLARLDGLYFHLYGLDRDDASYILSTFPIIQRQDQAQFGNYRTRNLILASINALAAGDTNVTVAV